MSEEDLLVQLDREQKICDGAQHILAAGGGSEELRSKVQAELAGALARISNLRHQLAQHTPPSDMSNLASDRHSVHRHATTLMHALRASFVNASGSAHGHTAHDNASLAAHPPADVSPTTSASTLSGSSQMQAGRRPAFASMGPPSTPSTTRQAQRARSAAAITAHARPQHNRTPSHAHGLGSMAHRRIDLMVRLADTFDRSIRLRYECPVDALIDCTFPCLADTAGKEVRASAYRLLRHAVVRPPWRLIRACRERGLDLYIIRTFLRDARFTIEKEQALKLVRCIMDCGSAENDSQNSLISPSVIRAMTAAVDHGDERLRLLYVETLSELAIHDVGLLIRSGGMRTLLNSSSDPSLEILPEVLAVLLQLVDVPSTRSFFRPCYDLVSVLAGFTDARDDDLNLDGTATAVSMLMRSWNGVLYMCLDQHRAIRSLVSALKVNPVRIQDKILDVFGQFFNLSSSNTMQNAKASRNTGRAGPSQAVSANRSACFNLIDSFSLLFAVILMDNGIIDALVHIVESRAQLAEKAMSLMQQLANISSSRIPDRYAHQLHAMPALFRTRFEGEADGRYREERERASSVLLTLEHFAAKRLRQGHADHPRLRSDSSIVPTRTSAPLDETAFRNLMLEANVLSSKDNGKWNLDALQTLFENLLVHPKRLEEAMRASKLVRRILAFYHPFSMRYTALPNATVNHRYTKLGCTVLQTLTSSADGMKFLNEDRLLKELAECLDTDVMSDQRLVDSMAGGYFEFLGVLSKSAEGIQAMHHARLFTALFRVLERRRRTDMARAMLRHLDFSADGHCRVLLSRILAHRSRQIRIEAMKVVATMIKVNPNRWLVRLLVGQLHDPVSDVRLLASDMLLEACSHSDAILDMVVSARPMLHEGSHSLLLRFLSTPSGLRFLLQGDYIEREMEVWFNRRNVVYLNQIEALLCQAFSVSHEGNNQVKCWDGSVPPHFYGELVKTVEGCTLLDRKGHFADFSHFIRLHAAEEADAEVLIKLKSILWAVGNIGACRGGISFLEAEVLVGTIVHMAETTKVASLRGTCFFVLGLIATTQLGAELLQDAGWSVSVTTSLDPSRPFGFCIPSPAFLSLPPWTVRGDRHISQLKVPNARLERTITSHLASLGNTIIATKASRALTRLKERHPLLFMTHEDGRHPALRSKGKKLDRRTNGMYLPADRSAFIDGGTIGPSRSLTIATELFVRALHLFDTQPLRQSVRRYIWELFEVKLDDVFVQKILTCRRSLLHVETVTDPTSNPVQMLSPTSAQPASTSDPSHPRIRPSMVMSPTSEHNGERGFDVQDGQEIEMPEEGINAAFHPDAVSGEASSEDDEVDMDDREEEVIDEIDEDDTGDLGPARSQASSAGDADDWPEDDDDEEEDEEEEGLVEPAAQAKYDRTTGLAQGSASYTAPKKRLVGGFGPDGSEALKRAETPA